MSETDDTPTGPLVRNKINPTEYWDGEDFATYSFAEDLTELYNIATTVEADTMYWHNNLVWHRFGEQTLRSEIRAILRDASTRELVNEVVRNTKHLTRARREDIFDLPPEQIVVANGVVDLLTGEFTPLRKCGNPGTQTWIDVEYDPDAVPENFNEFLFDVLPKEDVSIMWEVIGYCLYRGYPFQKAFMLLGEGANGKSTLLKAIREFLGADNIAAVELQELAESRFKAAKLEGKLANLAPDISDDDLERTGTFKALTGGDLVQAERKYEDPFEFENTATLLFSANQKPGSEDPTYAYKRRWIHFKYPNTFEGDDAVKQEDLLESFRDEHAGILNVAIESFQDLWERGEFEKTSYDTEYGDDADDMAARPILRFVKNNLERTEGEHVRIKKAYKEYRAWANEHDYTVQGRKAKFEPLVEQEYAPATGKDPTNGNYKVWLDLQLSSDKSPKGVTDYE